MYPEMTINSAQKAPLGITMDQQKANKYALFCWLMGWRKRAGVELLNKLTKSHVCTAPNPLYYACLLRLILWTPSDLAAQWIESLRTTRAQ